MAPEYQSDDEQLEALKKWWQENGKSTVIGIALAISGVIGWQGWQKQQQENVEAASAVYQNLLTAVENNRELNDEQRATASHLADTLKKDYSQSIYAHFATFYKVKLAVQAKDLDTAESELRWLLSQNTSEEVSIEANLRLARVLYAKEQYDDALALLATSPTGYAAIYEELKGDIFLAKGDEEKAQLAYQKAVDLGRQATRPVNNPLLDLKAAQLTDNQGA